MAKFVVVVPDAGCAGCALPLFAKAKVAAKEGCGATKATEENEAADVENKAAQDVVTFERRERLMLCGVQWRSGVKWRDGMG